MGSLFDELQGNFSEMEANMRKLFRPAGLHICMYTVPHACCLTMVLHQEHETTDTVQLGVTFVCLLFG